MADGLAGRFRPEWTLGSYMDIEFVAGREPVGTTL